jgi:hypothetical protein
MNIPRRNLAGEDLAGGVTSMDGTEETEPARAKRGPVRRSSASPFLSIEIR